LVVSVLVTGAVLAKKQALAGGAPNDTLSEVVMSLHASAVEAPDLELLARAGLAAVAQRRPCLEGKTKVAALRLSCEGRSVDVPWPPADARAVTHALSAATRLVERRGQETPAMVQWVARALAPAIDDPYTAYLPPEMVAKLETSLQSRKATPGIELDPREPTRIREVRPGSVAARERLVEGDRVLAIDHEKTAALTYTELSTLLVGGAGTTVRLEVVPVLGGPTRTVILKRSDVPEPLVSVERLPAGALYVRVSSFAPGVARTVAEEIWEHGGKAVVLDLRHNEGGLVQEGVALLDVFFQNGSIGGVRPRQGRPTDDFYAGHQLTDVHVPLVVLIDGGSASASELVTLVLKERGRAVVLGSASLGKGSVQKVIRLPDGGALRVTSAHYIGPEGQPLDVGGIRPHKYLAPPLVRTVLEGGAAERDSWVLSALDVLEGGAGLGGSVDRARVWGPMP
jgi:carboxyl-terminal processing protease